MNNEVTKIKEVRVRPVMVPMKEPHRTASGTIEASYRKMGLYHQTVT